MLLRRPELQQLPHGSMPGAMAWAVGRGCVRWGSRGRGWRWCRASAARGPGCGAAACGPVQAGWQLVWRAGCSGAHDRSHITETDANGCLVAAPISILCMHISILCMHIFQQNAIRACTGPARQPGSQAHASLQRGQSQQRQGRCANHALHMSRTSTDHGAVQPLRRSHSKVLRAAAHCHIAIFVHRAF